QARVGGVAHAALDARAEAGRAAGVGAPTHDARAVVGLTAGRVHLGGGLLLEAARPALRVGDAGKAGLPVARGVEPVEEVEANGAEAVCHARDRGIRGV